MQDRKVTMELAVEIVSAYVSANTIADRDLPALLRTVHSTLLSLEDGEGPAASPTAPPAVPIKKSIHPDYIVCLEDGKRFKSLRRHIMSKYGLTPEAYRQKWGLAADYPMVAPNYARARSDLAKRMGLGTKKVTTPTPRAKRKRRDGPTD